MQKLYLTIVDTRYTTYAIGDTAEKSRQAALASALHYLNAPLVDRAPCTSSPTGYYETIQDVENELGCNTHEIPLNQGIQEY